MPELPTPLNVIATGPIPAPGVGSETELQVNTRVFRPPVTIPPTLPVLSAVAAGTANTVTPFANLSSAVANAAGLAATMFGAGAPTLEELPPAYAPKYPFNTILTESEAGHLFEVDDTPGAERLHLYHRTGSHVEMRPDGSVKYKCMATRQDVSVGNHEIIIEQGDWNIKVGGKYNLRVMKGELVIQADAGASINVTGKLKLNADDIELKATNHIFLNAPKVDVGATQPGGMPIMSLPGGVTFNEKWPFDPTLVPRLNIPLSPAGLTSAKKLILPDTRFDSAGSAVSKFEKGTKDYKKTAPSTPDFGWIPSLIEVARAVIGTIKFVAQLPSALLAIASTLKLIVNAAKLKPPTPSGGMVLGVIREVLTKGAVDASGELAFSRLKEQPGVIPLSNPDLYKLDARLVAARSRTFDNPEDVQNVDSYNAHINLSVELRDYAEDARNAPGTAIISDTTLPAAEPIPYTAISIETGLVSVDTGNTVITGTNTKFTEELLEGQTIRIGNIQNQIQSIVNNTTVLLTTPWTGSTVQSGKLESYRLRPIKEYFGIYDYTDESVLGSSGLTLGSLLVNFTSPVIEVPRVNTAMLTFGLGTPLLEGEGGDNCPGADMSIPSQLTTIQRLAPLFDLSTDEGAGQFVERVACELGPEWGIWRKPGGKNYNGHSVELLVYASPTPLYNGKYYQFVDIITSQGASNAKSGFSPTCEPFGVSPGSETNWFKPDVCPEGNAMVEGQFGEFGGGGNADDTNFF